MQLEDEDDARHTMQMQKSQTLLDAEYDAHGGLCITFYYAVMLQYISPVNEVSRIMLRKKTLLLAIGGCMYSMPWR